MKHKGLIALLLVTAAAVGVAASLSFSGGADGVDPGADRLVLPEIGKRLGEVARMTLVHGDAKTTLVDQGKRWVVEDKGDYPADGAKLHEALLGLAQLRYVEAKTKKPELYSRLEVEDAGKAGSKSTLITVSDAKGSLLGEIIAGKRRIDELGGGTDGVYVRKPGNGQSWLASGTLDLPDDAADWLDRSIVDLPREQVKEVELVQPDGSSLDIVHDTPEAKLELKDAPKDVKLKSDDVLVEPTTALASLMLTDVRPAAQMPLPATGVAHAVFTSFGGMVVKVALFDKDGKSWARFDVVGSGAAEKAAEALEAKLSPWVYAIPDWKAKSMRTKLADVTAPPKPS
ncbi:MAG TPA: DUF4340 domain-containing protein [Stellaceae bacterium]|jgi:hypothetical protein|nr:DUF4340 domain-containing protein [Stellaceae bacterium]